MVYSTMELKYDEGRVYGARYYTVEPVFVAHAPTWFKDEWQELEDWCTDTFGPTGSIWGDNTPTLHRWYVNNSKFWFRNKEDRDWFTLRWE